MSISIYPAGPEKLRSCREATLSARSARNTS